MYKYIYIIQSQFSKLVFFSVDFSAPKCLVVAEERKVKNISLHKSILQPITGSLVSFHGGVSGFYGINVNMYVCQRYQK